MLSSGIVLDCGDLIIPKGEHVGSFNIIYQFTPLYGRNYDFPEIFSWIWKDDKKSR